MTSERTDKRTVGLVLTWLFAIAIWTVIPGASLVWLATSSSQLALNSQLSTFAPVSSNDSPTSTIVDVALTWTVPMDVVAPEWTGIVATGPAVGAIVTSGDYLLTVGIIKRIAYHSSAPFTRTLGLGDVGSDVMDLNQLLESRNLPHDEGAEYSYLTADGADQLAIQIGALPADSTESIAFDPSWILFMPVDSLTIGTTLAVVGAPAPTPGTAVVQSAQLLSGAALLQSGSATAPTSPVTSPDSSPQGAVTGVPVVADPDSVLNVGTITVELGASRDAVLETELDLLATVVDTDVPTVEGAIITPSNPDYFVVPAASIFVTTSGGTCVRYRREGVVAALRVSVIGGTRGRAIVDGDLDSGDVVEVNPAASARTCS